jgi:hypothetical protein
MSSPHAVTIIARDQVEVATKISELITSVDVGSDEIIDFEVSSYGANQFLITLVYQDIWTIRSFSAKVGIKSIVRRVFVTGRKYTGKVGLKTIFALPVLGKPHRKVKVGLKAVFAYVRSVYNQWLASKAGLKATLTRNQLVLGRAFTPAKVGYHQKLVATFTQASGHIQSVQTIIG